jgi:transposase
MTVPGIGPYAAMVIVAELGNVNRFQNKRALASYAGLTPVVRESAGKRKRGGITHQGSNTLRWIMLQVAQVAARHSPGARSYYAGLRSRKPAQVAKIALARKMLTVVWVLLHHGVCFDEELFIRS